MNVNDCINVWKTKTIKKIKDDMIRIKIISLYPNKPPDLGLILYLASKEKFDQNNVVIYK